MARNLKPSQRTSLFPRAVPQMPEGYYSGDQPNPNLREFVEAHLAAHPYDPASDDYDAQALLQSSKVKRSTKIYNMHSYWSKKPHDSIRMFIEHYSREGDIVLDPFCGSGGSLLVSALTGRCSIGVDLSPAATFFSAVLCAPPDLTDFADAFRSIMSHLRHDYGWLYEVIAEGATRTVHFGISSLVFECLRCLTKSSIYRDTRNGTTDPKCPACGETIKTTQKKLGYRLDEWHVQVGRGEHAIIPINGILDDNERVTLQRIYQELHVHRPPTLVFPERGRTQVLAVRGIKSLSDLYTPRNLLALCLYRDACDSIVDDRLRRALLFVLTACCLKASRMMGLNSDGIGRIQKNGLIAQLIVKDVNVFDFLEIAFRGIYDGFAEVLSEAPQEMPVILSTQSAVSLVALPPNSIDYIFTDPPYGERVQFWESNQVWEAWLGFRSTWDQKELIINRTRGLDDSHWRDVFRRAMEECRRVLKPGRWITLTYNDRDTWPLLQDVMLDLGFVPDESEHPIAMETTAKSEKQLKGEDNTIRDLVVNFRKPRTAEGVGSDGLLTGDEDGSTFQEKVCRLVRDTLLGRPGMSLDTITEVIISRMLRRGDLETGNLAQLIAIVAEESPSGSGRWFLKRHEQDRVDESEMTKEDHAAQILEEYMRSRLTRHPHLQGLRFHDMYEHYLYAVKERDKPRRPPQEWLRDYFYLVEDGAVYRAPNTEEEREAKRLERAKGTSYKIKRYLAYLQVGVAVPAKERPSDATLAEWIRACKRAGLFEQGKQLYEKGGLRLEHLSEEAQVNVEEDYQVCVRMLARVGVGSASASSRKG